MAATTSLFLALALGSVASAQPVEIPKIVDWQAVVPSRPQPIADVDPVQFKPLPPEQVPPIQGDKAGQIGESLGAKIRQQDDVGEFMIRTEPPGLDQLTQRRSEQQLQDLLREENRRRPGEGRIYFPEEEPVSTAPFTARQSPPRVHYVEPFYVSHSRLYFEQRNFERYGWSLGPIDPAVQLGTFYYDLVMLPYHIGSDACHCYDSSAGKCLPGDPTPLLLYRERFSVTGLVFEAGTILGGLFIFP
jgi:hypothetical protein